MDSFNLDGEPDSAELLMMEIDIPEPEKQEDRDADRNMDFDSGSDFEDFLLDDRFLKETIRTHSFLNCGLSKEFSVDGFVVSEEFERFLKNEQPVHFDPDEDDVKLFGFPASVFSPIEESDLFTNLFIQRFGWIETRVVSRKAQIFLSTSSSRQNDVSFDVDVVLDEMSSYLQLLRLLSQQISLQKSTATLEDISRLIQLLHTLHLHAGKLSDLPPEVFSDTSSKSNSPNSVLLHVVITVKWTILACLGYLSRSKNEILQTNSDIILPRFSQFVGHGWSEDVLFENRVDVLSVTQLDRLYRQVSFGLMFELTEMSERRLKMFEISSNSDSFSLSSKHSAFSCSCFKEIWLMLINVSAQRPKDFWTNFSSLFESVSTNSFLSNNLPIEDVGFEQNSSQLQFARKEFSFKISFWMIHNLAPLSQLSSTGREEELSSTPTNSNSPEIRVLPLIEKLLKQFPEESSRLHLDEMETRAYLGVVHSLSKLFPGASVTVLFSLWELFHPKLNESFMISALTLDGLATLPVLFSDWLEKIDKLSEPQIDLSNKNSFELFLAIVSLHLSGDGVKSDKMTKQFFGRVRTKLTPQKWSGLEERGLFHAMSLFLVLFRIRSDVSFIVNALCESLNKMENAKIKGTVLFKGLCAVFVLLVGKREVVQAGQTKMSILQTIFAAILSQSEKIISGGNALQHSNLIKTYSQLLRDPDCLSSDLLISQSGIFSPFLIKFLEKKATADIIHAFHYVVLRLLRYYQDVWHNGTPHLSEEEQARRRQIDATCTQVWRLLFPLLKTHLCSAHTKSGPFIELAELAYGLTVLSFHCTSAMKQLWTAGSGSQSPPFEKPDSLFKIFGGFNHQINLLVSCAFLGHILTGELSSEVASEMDVLEVWSKVATLLPAQMHFASEEINYQLHLTTEQVFKSKFIQKLNLPPHASAVGQDFFKNVIAGVGVFITKNPGLIFEVESECEVIVKTFVGLLSSKVEDEKLTIRFIQVGSLFIKHWSGPLLYTETEDRKSFRKNFVGNILRSTILKSEYSGDGVSIPPNVKNSIRTTLPFIFQGLTTLMSFATLDTPQRYLKKIFATYVSQFPASESHPMSRLFSQSSSEDLRPIQNAFFSFIQDPLFSNTKKVKTNRPQLHHALNVVRCGLVGKPSNISVLENVVSNFFPKIFEIYVGTSHEDQAGGRACEDIFKIVLEVSKSTRIGVAATNALHRALESDAVTFWIRDRLPLSNVENFVHLLSLFAATDPQLVRNLGPFLEKTFSDIEFQRHKGLRTGPWTTFLSDLLKKIGRA